MCQEQGDDVDGRHEGDAKEVEVTQHVQAFDKVHFLEAQHAIRALLLNHVGVARVRLFRGQPNYPCQEPVQAMRVFTVCKVICDVCSVKYRLAM